MIVSPMTKSKSHYKFTIFIKWVPRKNWRLPWVDSVGDAGLELRNRKSSRLKRIVVFFLFSLRVYKLPVCVRLGEGRGWGAGVGDSARGLQSLSRASIFLELFANECHALLVRLGDGRPLVRPQLVRAEARNPHVPLTLCKSKKNSSSQQ